jgi:hypothetical protein
LVGCGLQPGQLVRQPLQALGDFGETLLARCRASRMADVDRDRLGPGAGQGSKTKSPIERNPGFALPVIVVGACDRRQHLLDRAAGHWTVVGHSRLQPTRERGGMGPPPQQLRVVQQPSVLAGLQPAIGRDPGVEQAGGLEGGFEQGTLRRRHLVAKIHQLPERRS